MGLDQEDTETLEQHWTISLLHLLWPAKERLSVLDCEDELGFLDDETSRLTNSSFH
jgi:hypothetical protein